MDNQINSILSIIKKRRRTLGYTQADVARMCGIKQANYSRMESGRQLPNMDTLMNILNSLDLKLNVFPCDEIYYIVMWRNKPVANVILTNGKKNIRFEKLEADGIHQPFSGNKLDHERFYRFIKSRCYEDGRADLKIILEKAHMSSNNPYDFIRISHGVTFSDDFWIKTSDEFLKWEDVKIR